MPQKKETIVWVTDPHLNFISASALKDFIKHINSFKSDKLLITGDIGEAPTVSFFLQTLAKEISKDIYFILGNHDFYHSNINDVRVEVSELSNNFDNLHYLTSSNSVIELSKNTGLIGHDSWYDCSSGSFIGSGFKLSDFYLIDEYKNTNLYDENIINISKQITQNSLEYIGYYLREGLKKYKSIIVATHVPPFPRASMHEGKPSDKFALPFFSCVTLGEVISNVAGEFSNNKVTVLSGHTHSPGEFHLENIHCYVAGAKYYNPEVYTMISYE